MPRPSVPRLPGIPDCSTVAKPLARSADAMAICICAISVCFDGEPRLFDCIEFNDQIATVDVLYDLAFLLMDLWHRGFPELANLVMNRYLDEADDEDGFALLPFFMAVRAAVRAHVTATQVEEGSANSDKIDCRGQILFRACPSVSPGKAAAARLRSAA